jgi:hypothetical protein
MAKVTDATEIIALCYNNGTPSGLKLPFIAAGQRHRRWHTLVWFLTNEERMGIPYRRWSKTQTAV